MCASSYDFVFTQSMSYIYLGNGPMDNIGIKHMSDHNPPSMSVHIPPSMKLIRVPVDNDSDNLTFSIFKLDTHEYMTVFSCL